MAPDVLRADQIEVTPSGFFALRYEFRSPIGPLGVLNLFAFRTEGQFQDADGREWRMGRSHWWRRNYELRAGDTVVATAQGRGIRQVVLDLDFLGQLYRLEPTDWWGGKWRLLGPAGTAVLEIRRREVLRPGLVLDVLGPVAGELMAFAVYLILTVWREHAAAAAASV
ncbi:MAG: hypothetical protein D6793_08680 [Thermoflexia bacterium]|nr:MAG: hypothetical protein D6793_08680 [Thermoflexia bacterium]